MPRAASSFPKRHVTFGNLGRLSRRPGSTTWVSVTALSVTALLVHWLAAAVHKARRDEPNPVAVVEQFFQSPEAANVPFEYISSRLWATIAQQVRGKTPRQPKSSDHFEVQAISTCAPDCPGRPVYDWACRKRGWRGVRRVGARWT